MLKFYANTVLLLKLTFDIKNKKNSSFLGFSTELAETTHSVDVYLSKHRKIHLIE